MQPRSASTPRIAITCEDPALGEQAARLRLALGLEEAADQPPDFLLHLSEDHLELRRAADPSLTGPILAEFVAGAAGYRRRHGGHEMLLRAVGRKGQQPLTVLDATGGLGRDAFVLASHGCTVLVVERNPVVAALLADGLRRALAHPATAAAAARITLRSGDSRQVLAELADKGQRLEVVYLDPMFPQRTKSAKVKKELQVLQLLAGRDEEDGGLLAAALKAATGRVVVKRPRGAPPLPGPPPSHAHPSKAIRFDVYLRPGNRPGGAGGETGQESTRS